MPEKTRGRRPRKTFGGSALNLQAMAAELALVELPAQISQPATLPPQTRLDQRGTSRLLPARYSESVLTRIADSDDDLQLIYALDGATNERLLAQAGDRPSVRAAELAVDRPYARIVNAAFTHPHPLGARFSTPARGAWYAAFELATAKAEVVFHRSIQLIEIGWQQAESLDYDHYHADFHGNFHDLSDLGAAVATVPVVSARLFPAEQRLACLAPGSYLASQQLAAELLEAGSLGIRYPSTRRAGGTCVACFQAAAVENVRKRELHRLTWRPDAPPVFPRIPRGEHR
jgi:hypothetical protein